jgi:hypothetical protein
MVSDKTVMKELMAEDPNFVNPLYIHLAQKLLHGVLYVLHLLQKSCVPTAMPWSRTLTCTPPRYQSSSTALS